MIWLFSFSCCSTSSRFHPSKVEDGPKRNVQEGCGWNEDLLVLRCSGRVRWFLSCASTSFFLRCHSAWILRRNSTSWCEERKGSFLRLDAGRKTKETARQRRGRTNSSSHRTKDPRSSCFDSITTSLHRSRSSRSVSTRTAPAVQEERSDPSTSRCHRNEVLLLSEGILRDLSNSSLLPSLEDVDRACEWRVRLASIVRC